VPPIPKDGTDHAHPEQVRVQNVPDACGYSGDQGDQGGYPDELKGVIEPEVAVQDRENKRQVNGENRSC